MSTTETLEREAEAGPLLSNARSAYIALCTPTRGMVSIQWASCLANLQACWPKNIGCFPNFVYDSIGGEIAEVRNACVQSILDHTAHDFTHIMWLDDDVLCNPAVVKQLIGHDAPIVSGVYFTRDPVAEPMIYPAPGRGSARYVPADRTMKVWGHGMGLTLVKIEVYRTIAERLELPKDKYGRPQFYRTIKPGIDEPINDTFHAVTEDLWFCDLARQAGYHCLVDLSRAAFGWHFDGRTQQGYPQRQWADIVNRRPIVWDTPEGPIEWR